MIISGTATLSAGNPAAMVEQPGSTPQNRIYVAEIPAGFDGATWFGGTGAPAVGLGDVGDFYIDLTPSQTRVYGPKPAADDWGDFVRITGDQGIPGQSGLPLNDTIRTSSFTAVSGYRYAFDTTGGPITMTLSPSPSPGDRGGIIDVGGVAGTNPITLNGNGANIYGSTDDVIVDANRIGLSWVYVNATIGWIFDETVAVS
jgi:hypothetical protein